MALAGVSRREKNVIAPRSARSASLIRRLLRAVRDAPSQVDLSETVHDVPVYFYVRG